MEEMERTMRQSESSFRHQIILHEEKAHDNWLRARALQREVFVKDTESHELRQRTWYSTPVEWQLRKTTPYQGNGGEQGEYG
ncbi:transport and Golgi organization protein 1 homolog [Tamandua tetradactyla]|uniref:transport and Golgi organization protein 1 homolog n=1 Tax=Tamandua tetradactyla TaxID=48850 RepID=UPI004054306B